MSPFELDERVAVEVMGWTERDPAVLFMEAPAFSTDIAAAWTVVEKMRADGWHVQVDSLGFVGEEWRVCFWRHDDADGEHSHTLADGPSPSIAICKAALQAKEGAA